MFAELKYAAGGLLVLVATSSQVLAGDAMDTPIAGTIGGGYQYSEFGNGALGPNDVWSNSFFGDSALLLRLGESNLNFQVDGAFNHDELTDGTDSIKAKIWHLGGSTFYRDPSWGLVGVDGAFGGITAESTTLHTLRFGGRAEAYLGDMATLAARAGYTSLKISGQKLSGDYVDLSATLYVMPEWAFKPQFEFTRLKANGDKADFYLVGAETEFGLDDLMGAPVSVFAGAHYSTIKGAGGPSIDQTAGLVGIRFYFGSGNTLRDHHRSGSVENTDYILERGFLPL